MSTSNSLNPGRREWLLGVLALAAAGCGRGRARISRDEVTLLYPADENVFMPLVWPAQFLMFLPLIGYDTRGEIEERLATAWEHSADYREWTFHLRPGVRWHDGTPVTADDVRFTMELMNDVFFKTDGGWIESITVPGPITITVRYVKPNDAADWWPVLPKHLLQDLDRTKYQTWDFWTHPIGNGPYRYVRHVPKTMVELEANRDYYLGAPRIGRAILKFGGSTAATELLSGSVDAADFVSAADVLHFGADARFRTYYSIFPGVSWLHVIAWNHRDPRFSDRRVRRALTLAINRKELHQARSLPEDLPIFDTIFTRRQYWRRELPAPIPYDPEEANRLLDAAGWRDRNGDGVRRRGTEPFAFTALAVSGGGSGLDAAAVYVQAQLRRLGIRMEVQTYDWGVTKQKMNTGAFQAVFQRLHNGDHAAWFGEPSLIGYRNPHVAALLERAASIVDHDELDRIYDGLMSIFEDEVPVTFLSPEIASSVARRRIRGLSSPLRADPVSDMGYLWIEE